MIPITRSTIEQPKMRLTLLDLARAAAKDQWSVGEVSYIWGNQTHGAYLRNNNCKVVLYTTNHEKPGLVVFVLNLRGWVEVEDLDRKYANWKNTVNNPRTVGMPKLKGAHA